MPSPWRKALRATLASSIAHPDTFAWPLIASIAVAGSACAVLALSRLRLALPAHGEMGHAAFIPIELVGSGEARVALMLASIAVAVIATIGIVLLATAVYSLRRRTAAAAAYGALALVAAFAALGGLACIRGDIGP